MSYKAVMNVLVALLAIALPSTGQTATPAGSQPLGQGSGNGAASNTTFFESQMLSYGALDQVTSKIADNVCTATKKAHLVLFDTTSFLTVQQYRSFKKEVDVLTSLFNSFSATDDAEAAAGGPSLQVAEGIYSTISGVIGASTADKNSTFPLSDVAVAASLSQHLKTAKGCDFDVTYPRIAMADTAASFEATDKAISKAFRRLFDAQRAAAKAVQTEENRTKDRDLGIGGSSGTGITAVAQSAQINTQFPNPLQVTVKDAAGNPLSNVFVLFTAPASGASGTFANGNRTTTLPTNATGVASTPFTANATAGTYSVVASVGTIPAVSFALTNYSAPPAAISAGAAVAPAPSPATPPSAPPRSVMGSDYLSLTGATGLMNQFLSSYALPAATTGVSPASAVLAGAQLLSILNTANEDTYILFWEASAAGGTQRDRKNLFTNVFSGDLLRYSGGVVVSFGMINAKTGQLVAPVLHRLLIPYTTIADPPKAMTDAARKGSSFDQ